MAPKMTPTADLQTWTRRCLRAIAPLTMSLVLASCATIDAAVQSVTGRAGPQQGQPGFVSGFLGSVVADEPRAALAGKNVLSAGGNAADAAIAVGLSLAVTLPSRAGLGGGGACLVYHPGFKGAPEAIVFVPPPARSGRVAVPALARGLFLLHARHGHLPFETQIAAAEQLARLGVPVSIALAKDLALVAGPLFVDPGARAVFGTGAGPLAPGQTMIQPELAATLAQMRTSGVGDMYVGPLGRRIETASTAAGTPITMADLRTALPKAVPPVVIAAGDDQAAFLPPPADGGVAAAAAFTAVRGAEADMNTASARSLAAAARGRAGGVTVDQVVGGPLAAVASIPIYPASTSFATMDQDGNAVVCALTMNNLFGGGRLLPGLGFLAAPEAASPPLLSAGLIWNERKLAFRAAAGGSGQSGAPLAVAAALANTLQTKQPMAVPVPDPGRANVIACAEYLPGAQSGCGAAADPREAGLAAGTN